MIAPFPWEGEQNPAYALLSTQFIENTRNSEERLEPGACKRQVNGLVEPQKAKKHKKSTS